MRYKRCGIIESKDVQNLHIIEAKTYIYGYYGQFLNFLHLVSESILSIETLKF